MSSGMTVSDKNIVFWKILETHLEESKCTPVHDVAEWTLKEEDLFPSTDRGCEGNFCYTPAKSQPTFLSCNPRDRHVMHCNL